MPPTTLVDGRTYLVIPADATSGFANADVGGLYHRDTRHLSALRLELADRDLVRIGETLERPFARTETFAPASSAVNRISERNVPKHTHLTVTRERQVCEDVGYVETVSVANHSPESRTVELAVSFDVDFADLFEVRGLASDIDREIATVVDDSIVRRQYTFECDGSGETYGTTMSFASEPQSLSEDRASFALEIGPGRTETISFTASLGEDPVTPGETSPRTPPIELPVITPEDDRLADVFRQAAADLAALTTETEHGPVPLAGTPWFVTPFGRDGMITALQVLPFTPALAEGTLRYFAANRGRESDRTREEAPGKVFHEIRHGELAAREEIPHTPYYGTIDATALWVLLLAETCEWRGSHELATDLGAALVAALDWICRTSDEGPDDPFLYYDAAGDLSHKAWKDTADSIRFADGTPAEPPLAVAEVQGYAEAALRRGAKLLSRIDADVDHEPYADHAREIRRRFDAEFWLPEQSYYAVAKNGDGRIVDSVTSNVGHCLWTETIPAERADDVIATLLDDSLAGGWGLRTLDADNPGYSPVSYHAGGVWPHDTSLVALGLAKYGRGDAAERLGRQVLSASTTFRNERLPELYCAFDRDRDPAAYPAACVPQAWAAGAPYAFLRAAFDLRPTDDGTATTGRSPDLFDAGIDRHVNPG